MNEVNILTRSIQDFLTPKMLKFAILPFILTAILMYLLFFVVIGIGIEQIMVFDVQSSQTYMLDGIPHTETITSKLGLDELLSYLMKFALTSWIATFLVYIVGFFIATFASIFVAVIVIGFLTPAIMRVLQQRHYLHVEMIGHSNIFNALILLVKWTVIMGLLFIVLIPLYFIPFVNIIAFNIPLYYFFHKMLTYDISSTLCTSEEDKQIKYFAKNKIRFKTALLYGVSLIPFAIFFGAIFYVIYIGNTYFIEVKKLRS